MNNSDLAFDLERSPLTGECFTVGPGVMPASNVLLHRKENPFVFIDRSLLIIAKQMVVC